MMRRCTMALLALLVAASVAFAAGEAEQAGAEGGTVNVYVGLGGIDTAEEVIALYEERNPDVEVNLIRGPSTWADHVSRTTLWMRNQFAGVDVLYHDDSITMDGVDAEAWVNLSDHLDQAVVDDLVGLQREFLELHGGMYRMPWWNGISYLYYRTDLFEESGVDIPETWDELLVAAEELTLDTDGDGDLDQWGYLTQGGAGEMYNNFIEFLMQAGGEQLQVAVDGEPTEEAVEALTMMRDLLRASAPEDLSEIDYNQSRALFREGRVAMLRDWGSMGTFAVEEGLEDVIGVMPFPAGPAGSYGIGDSWGLVVNRYGSNYQQTPEVVMDFIRFFADPEVHKMTASLQAPAFRTVLNDEAFMEELGEQNLAVRRFDEFIDDRLPRDFPPGTAVEYLTGVGEIVNRYLLGSQSPEDTAIELQEHIDDMLGQ
ncbi:MAG: extracellular solute-binding protein [Spirochaetota bacterium]